MEFVPSEAPEVDVEEAAGIIELPITGFVIHPRLDSVRLVGYINRGSAEVPRREATIILHVPLTGFMRSMARMITRWRGIGPAIH